MGTTYWYAYDRSGTVSGPYFETRAEAADACDDSETPRPVSGDVIDTGGEEEQADDADEYDQIDDHDELKELAREKGVADEANLRSKESIREALRD